MNYLNVRTKIYKLFLNFDPSNPSPAIGWLNLKRGSHMIDLNFDLICCALMYHIINSNTF